MRGHLSRVGITVLAVSALLLPLGAATSSTAADTAGSDGSGLRAVLAQPPKLERAGTGEASTQAPDGGSVTAQKVTCPKGRYDFNRTESCSNYGTKIDYYLNGTWRGKADIHVETTVKLNPRNRYKSTYTAAMTLTNPPPTVPEALASIATVSISCSTCTATSNPGPRVLIPGTRQTFGMEVSSPGRGLVGEGVVLRATIKTPRHTDSTANVGPVFRPRCDSTARVTDARTGGCVYPQFAPSWQLSVNDSNVAAVAWHVDWAQRNLKHAWGVKGKGYPLHRTFDQALQRENRREACVRGVPRPPNSGGQSCDEFPMAQTHEGASKNADYSCHFLNARQNSKEGSLRKSFLNGQRVLERDAFWVQVIKPSGAVAPSPYRTSDVGLLGPVGCGQDSNP
ncbi:NucA/NucB deoxyribonuclease domain-containing protein [Streptomyces sp. ISL-11]|uniref:NucA/NucB deoxyribonuclease domain-containing protein n=1 Tax=Streptomyces sp. ISL-11 TaxID=2819174 RepID=UPI001BE8B64B|nr:hypothetical protein [Streptomyces sp. ISL-11]MBT2387713.1 hypothetical protein [Streptomyces sp. ISL-11]